MITSSSSNYFDSPNSTHEKIKPIIVCLFLLFSFLFIFPFFFNVYTERKRKICASVCFSMHIVHSEDRMSLVLSHEGRWTDNRTTDLSSSWLFLLLNLCNGLLRLFVFFYSYLSLQYLSVWSAMNSNRSNKNWLWCSSRGASHIAIDEDRTNSSSFLFNCYFDHSLLLSHIICFTSMKFCSSSFFSIKN